MLDTGSARTLVSSSFALAAKLSSNVASMKEERRLALDGKALPISGQFNYSSTELTC